MPSLLALAKSAPLAWLLMLDGSLHKARTTAGVVMVEMGSTAPALLRDRSKMRILESAQPVMTRVSL